MFSFLTRKSKTLKNEAVAKIGVVGLQGSWSSELLADTLFLKTGFRCLINMEKIVCDLENDKVFFKDHDLTTFDALIIKKVGKHYSPHLMDRLEILCNLADKGVKIFSDPRRIMGILSRLSCTLKLKQSGLPLPPTVVTEDMATALDTVKRFGKAVLKPLYTSKARGMVVVEDTSDAEEVLSNFIKDGNKIFYLQKFIPIPGMDLGMVFLGGKYLATYSRVARQGSWNTTTSSGGQYRPFEPSRELITLSHKAQDIFKLDFTCVDIVETKDGPKIFEVSAFGGFKGLLEAADINAARLYGEYVIKKVKNRTTL